MASVVVPAGPVTGPAVGGRPCVAAAAASFSLGFGTGIGTCTDDVSGCTREPDSDPGTDPDRATSPTLGSRGTAGGPAMNFRRIQFMVVKEIQQIRRDRRLFGILLIAPLLQLLVLGYAATTDARQIALGIRDDDRTFHSREFARTLTASDYFTGTLLSGPASADGDLLVSGAAGVIVVIPAGFGRTLEAGQAASVQALVDGADSNFAVHGLDFLQRACRRYTEGLVGRVLPQLVARTGRALPAVAIECRVWYNPDLASRLFMVPAVMGVLLLVTTMIVTSMALVKEREQGTLEQLIVTPLRSGELIAGKLLPFVVIGFAEVTLALPFMLLIFGVPLRGSVPLLYLFAGFFLLTTLGLGLFISTLVRTQQQAMMLAAFFVMLPFILLSGFIFPVENMPPAIQAVARFIPLRFFLNLVRGIFLKGTGWAELWQDAVALLAWGLGILALAVVSFRKKLD